MKKILILMLLFAGGLQAFSQIIPISIKGIVYRFDTNTIEKKIPITIVFCDSNKVPFDSVVSKDGVFNGLFKHSNYDNIFVFFKSKKYYPAPINISSDIMWGETDATNEFNCFIKIVLKKRLKKEDMRMTAELIPYYGGFEWKFF